MPRVAIQIGVKTTMAFERDDGGKIKLSSLKLNIRTTMRSMGQHCWCRCQRQHQQTERNKLAGDTKKLHRKEIKEQSEVVQDQRIAAQRLAN